jgi:hypothetical protein
MLEIKKTAIPFDENELMRLEGIIIDEDETEALKFLKRAVYNKIAKGQQDRLKSHLDTMGDPVKGFKRNNP